RRIRQHGQRVPLGSLRILGRSIQLLLLPDLLPLGLDLGRHIFVRHLELLSVLAHELMSVYRCRLDGQRRGSVRKTRSLASWLGGNCARVNAVRGLAKREETTDVASGGDEDDDESGRHPNSTLHRNRV